MKIALVNQSTVVPNDAHGAMAAACQLHLTHHVAPAWGRLPPSIVCASTLVEALAGAPDAVVVMLDDADQAGALGYHDEQGDLIDGKVFARTVLHDGNGVLLYDASNPQRTSVASVLAHELDELFLDPFVNGWCDGPRIAQGSEYATEIGDPVEADSYVVSISGGQQVSVTNFVLPRWFDPEATGLSGYDYMGRLTGPFTMTAGGYMVVRNGPGSEQQVMGALRPAWRIAMQKSSPLSRLAQRIGS